MKSPLQAYKSGDRTFFLKDTIGIDEEFLETLALLWFRFRNRFDIRFFLF